MHAVQNTFWRDFDPRLVAKDRYLYVCNDESFKNTGFE